MELKTILSFFNLTDKEIALYDKLFYGGMMGASELSKRMGISRTSVYDQIAVLKKMGLISESLEGGIKKFLVQPPSKIIQLIGDREREIQSVKIGLVGLEKEYNSKLRVMMPRIQIYRGRSELQQMIKDVLLYRDITLYSYWSIGDTLETLTPAFFAKYHKERAERNIFLKAIWSKNQAMTKKVATFLSENMAEKREIRIAPSDKNFTLGYEIYANKVCFISSSKESYGFIVESNELAQTMKIQHEIIWGQSKKL